MRRRRRSVLGEKRKAAAPFPWSARGPGRHRVRLLASSRTSSRTHTMKRCIKPRGIDQFTIRRHLLYALIADEPWLCFMTCPTRACRRARPPAPTRHTAGVSQALTARDSRPSPPASAAPRSRRPCACCRRLAARPTRAAAGLAPADASGRARVGKGRGKREEGRGKREEGRGKGGYREGRLAEEAGAGAPRPTRRRHSPCTPWPRLS